MKVVVGEIEVLICKAMSFKHFSKWKNKLKPCQRGKSYEMIAVERKENGQCTKEIRIENYKIEQRQVNHLIT